MGKEIPGDMLGTFPEGFKSMGGLNFGGWKAVCRGEKQRSMNM